MIRDEAGPNRPVIGIAALGNAVLGLNQRDDAVGWSTNALLEQLDASSPEGQRSLAGHLLTFARAEVSRVHADDFEWVGLSSAQKIQYLEGVAAAADNARRAAWPTQVTSGLPSMN